MQRIADGVMEVNKKRLHDKSLKKVLIEERDQIQKSLDNIMKAIEAGILTSTTKSRMEELEEQIALVNDKIAIEEYKEKNSLRKEQVIEYLTHQVRQSPKMMLFALIQKIVLYDDKVEIYYNYIKNPYPDNFSPEIDRDSSFIECSIVLQSGAPQKRHFKLSVFFVYFSNPLFFVHCVAKFEG